MKYFTSLVVVVFPLLLDAVSGSAIDIFERRLQKEKCKKTKIKKCFMWKDEEECACAKKCDDEESWFHECGFKNKKPVCKCTECPKKDNKVKVCKFVDGGITQIVHEKCECGCDDSSVETKCKKKKGVTKCKCEKCKSTQEKKCTYDDESNEVCGCHKPCEPKTGAQSCFLKNGKIKCKCEDCKALGKISVCDGPGPFGMCECKCKTEESEKCVYAKNGGEICGCEKPCKKETDASVCTGKKGKLKCKCKDCKKLGKVSVCSGEIPWRSCECRCKEGEHEFCKKKGCSCQKIPKCDNTAVPTCPDKAKTPKDCKCRSPKCDKKTEVPYCPDGAKTLEDCICSPIPTDSPTLSPSITPSPSPSSSSSSSCSCSASPSPSASGSLSPSATPSASPSASATPSASPSASATPSATPSASPSASATPSASPSASATPSASPSVSGSASGSASGSGCICEDTSKKIGCFKDGPNRAMPYRRGSAKSMQGCIKNCNGFRYAGRQWRGECWCADAGYGRYGREPSGCICDGYNVGPWRNCVYRI